MQRQGKQTVRPHYLLTALGVHPHLTQYALNQKQESAEYSLLALLKLLNKEDRPDTVRCLLADKARAKLWDGFAKAIRPLTAVELAGETEAGSSTITTEGDGAS